MVDRILKLKEIKQKRSLSYEALAHELGVHSQSVFRWLQRGVVPRSRPTLDAIDRYIAKNGGKDPKDSTKPEELITTA